MSVRPNYMDPVAPSTRDAIRAAKQSWAKMPNTVTIFQRPNGMQFEYRWGDNVGNYWSPAFDNVVDCVKYAEGNGLKIMGNISEETPC